MWVKKYRLQRSWSQEQLAEMSGLSVRTIQRFEKGQQPGFESLKALASVFELDISQLQQEQTMSNFQANQSKQSNRLNKEEQEQVARPWITHEEEQALKYVEHVKGFYIHFMIFAIIMPGLIGLNLWLSPKVHWFYYALFPWIFAILLQAVLTFPVFRIFTPEWEKRQVEKRLGRKL